MYRIGMSSCGNQLDRELFFNYAKAGITAMEVSPKQGRYNEVDLGELKRLSSEYGVELWSFHLPFMPFELIDISSSDAKKRKSSVEYTASLIKKAAAAGIDKYVIHPSGEPIADAERAERLQRSAESLSYLSRVAAECGGTLAAEDLPRSCIGRDSGEIKTLLDAAEDMRVCFDTNHLLKEKISDFIDNVGDKIITVHISDYDFADEKHWLPGEGDIDWRSLVARLKGAGYAGVWMYEVGPFDSRYASGAKGLCCEDFVKNARDVLFKDVD